MLSIWRRLASVRISIISVAKSRELKVASFWRPYNSQTHIHIPTAINGLGHHFEPIRTHCLHTCAIQHESCCCMYIILTEKEVNTGYTDRAKDRGKAEVFYEVNTSCIDRFWGQYYLSRLPTRILPLAYLFHNWKLLYTYYLYVYTMAIAWLELYFSFRSPRNLQFLNQSTIA